MEYNCPIDCKRYRIRGLKGRDHYVIIDDEGIMVTFPDNDIRNYAYHAAATALARMVSVSMQAGLGMAIIEKQLTESSMQEYDLPHVLLQAIKRYKGDKVNDSRRKL
jgi:hypothetical protein